MPEVRIVPGQPLPMVCHSCGATERLERVVVPASRLRIDAWVAYLVVGVVLITLMSGSGFVSILAGCLFWFAWAGATRRMEKRDPIGSDLLVVVCEQCIGERRRVQVATNWMLGSGFVAVLAVMLRVKAKDPAESEQGFLLTATAAFAVLAIRWVHVRAKSRWKLQAIREGGGFTLTVANDEVARRVREAAEPPADPGGRGPDASVDASETLP